MNRTLIREPSITSQPTSNTFGKWRLSLFFLTRVSRRVSWKNFVIEFQTNKKAEVLFFIFVSYFPSRAEAWANCSKESILRSHFVLSEKTQQVNVDCSRHPGDENNYSEKKGGTWLTKSRRRLLDLRMTSGRGCRRRWEGGEEEEWIDHRKTPGVFLAYYVCLSALHVVKVSWYFSTRPTK